MDKTEIAIVEAFREWLRTKGCQIAIVKGPLTYAKDSRHWYNIAYAQFYYGSHTLVDRGRLEVLEEMEAELAN